MLRSVTFLAVLLGLVAFSYADHNCTSYCELMVNASCTGGADGSFRGQYTDLAQCLQMCGNALWPVGIANVNGTGENTLGCRQYHAGVALLTGVETHCAHAGFFSYQDQCGSYSENYCHFETAGCNYGGPAAACADMVDMYFNTTVSAVSPSASMANQNTLGCRLYHQSVAFQLVTPPSVLHCAHAFLASYQDQCGTTTEGFCEAMDTCAGEPDNFVSGCQTYADVNMPPMMSNTSYQATSGNSMSCRVYHANVAKSFMMANDTTNAAVHCAHASKSGGNQCGTWCENYCQLFMQNCPYNASNAEYTGYNTSAECATACAAFPTDGTPGATQGDNVQCRIYHAGVAGLTQPNVHCGHSQAVPDASCVDPSSSSSMSSMSSMSSSSSASSVPAESSSSDEEDSASTTALSSLALLAAAMIALAF